MAVAVPVGCPQPDGVDVVDTVKEAGSSPITTSMDCEQEVPGTVTVTEYVPALNDVAWGVACPSDHK